MPLIIWNGFQKIFKISVPLKKNLGITIHWTVTFAFIILLNVNSWAKKELSTHNIFDVCLNQNDFNQTMKDLKSHMMHLYGDNEKEKLESQRQVSQLLIDRTPLMEFVQTSASGTDLNADQLLSRILQKYPGRDALAIDLKKHRKNAHEFALNNPSYVTQDFYQNQKEKSQGNHREDDQFSRDQLKEFYDVCGLGKRSKKNGPSSKECLGKFNDIFERTSLFQRKTKFEQDHEELIKARDQILKSIPEPKNVSPDILADHLNLLNFTKNLYLYHSGNPANSHCTGEYPTTQEKCQNLKNIHFETTDSNYSKSFHDFLESTDNLQNILQGDTVKGHYEIVALGKSCARLKNKVMAITKICSHIESLQSESIPTAADHYEKGRIPVPNADGSFRWEEKSSIGSHIGTFAASAASTTIPYWVNSLNMKNIIDYQYNEAIYRKTYLYNATQFNNAFGQWYYGIPQAGNSNLYFNGNYVNAYLRNQGFLF